MLWLFINLYKSKCDMTKWFEFDCWDGVNPQIAPLIISSQHKLVNKIVLSNIITGRKHGKKESQLFSHCGSFDHHALQPLNNCMYVFLGLPIVTLIIMGIVIHRWKGLENTSPTVYHTPHNTEFCNCKRKIETLESFSDCRSGWSKGPQWENDYGSFSHSFRLENIEPWAIEFSTILNLFDCDCMVDLDT